MMTKQLRSNLPGFSKMGIKLSYLLNTFISDCGGRSRLNELTTSEVCEKYVKPFTHQCQSSYCDTILRQRQEDKQNQIVKCADVFISHAWTYNFLAVLDTLHDHFKDENPDILIWFDLFSNNQHKTSELPREWWETVFKSAIEQFGYTVMIMSPWNNPVPYTRAWCIFEAYCTLQTNSRFEIAMGANDREQYMTDIENDPIGTIKTMLGIIDAEKSIASQLEDKEAIHRAIREEVGFSKVNELVFEQYRDWVVNVIKKELDGTNDEERICKLMNMLGLIYMGQGRIQDAEPFLKKCLHMQTSTLGPRHRETLRSMNRLAVLFSQQGKYDAAEKLHLDCFDNRIACLGAEHPSTLTSIFNLAGVYYSQGRPKLAEELYVACLMTRRKVLGPGHPSTLEHTNTLAELYTLQGRYEYAEKLYKSCLKMRHVSLGSQHLDTHNTMNSLAGLYALQGKYLSAEKLYVETLDHRRKALGPEHPDTLTSLNDLGVLHAIQKRYEESEIIFRDCVEKAKVMFGEDHHFTTTCTNNLEELISIQDGSKTIEQQLVYSCTEGSIHKTGSNQTFLRTSSTLLLAAGNFKSYRFAT